MSSKIPTPHINAPAGSFADTVLMPGDPLRSRFIAENYLENAELINNVRGIQGYTGWYRGKKVSVMASGMGCPSIGIYSWELIKDFGVQNLMRIGTAGSYHKDIHVRDIVVGIAASTDSNFVHAFELPGNYAPCCSYELLQKLERASEKTGIGFHAGNILSSDNFTAKSEDIEHPRREIFEIKSKK